MSTLAGMLLRTGGRLRPILVVICSGAVTALALVAIAMALLPEKPQEALFEVVNDPGTRGGAVFATALLIVPLVLLLHQTLRLGNAGRQRRLAGLRLAGATPGQVRVLGAGEVAFPAGVGALLGIGLFFLLRAALGGGAAGENQLTVGDMSHAVGLVPTSVTPPGWAMILVVVGVTLLGVALGLRVGRDVALSPHGVTRYAPTRPPSPWIAVLLLVAAVLAAAFTVTSTNGSVLALVASITLVVLGLMTMAPWSAYALGRVAQRRVTSVAGLLASQRLVSEPRPAGRAGAAVGGVGLVAGAVGSLLGSLLEDGPLEFFYLFSVLLVVLCLLATLLMVSLTLAVHAAESLTDRRRSISSLHALGVPASEIRSSLVWEGGLVAVPMSLLGAIIGAVALTGGESGLVTMVVAVLGVAVTPLLALVAVRLAVALTAPVARRAIDPENLRTA